MATWLPLVTRIRNIAEHACTSTGEDPFSHARTTLANPIERLLIAPYWVNYHAEHHLFMYLPCYRLPEAHRLLAEKGFVKRMEIEPGYLAGDAARDVARAWPDAYADVEASGRTRSAPRRPMAVPSKIPATATNDASASVDRPVRPCPTEQPSAITPPDAHQHGARRPSAACGCGELIAFPMKAAASPAPSPGCRRTRRRP